MFALDIMWGIYVGRICGESGRHLILYGEHWLPAVKMMGIVLAVSQWSYTIGNINSEKIKMDSIRGPIRINLLLDDLFH